MRTKFLVFFLRSQLPHFGFCGWQVKRQISDPVETRLRKVMNNRFFIMFSEVQHTQ